MRTLFFAVIILIITAGVNMAQVTADDFKVIDYSTTIEDVYEPFLIKEGFLQRTSRGRIAQEKAFKLLGKKQELLQRGIFND